MSEGQAGAFRAWTRGPFEWQGVVPSMGVMVLAERRARTEPVVPLDLRANSGARAMAVVVLARRHDRIDPAVLLELRARSRAQRA